MPQPVPAAPVEEPAASIAEEQGMCHFRSLFFFWSKEIKRCGRGNLCFVLENCVLTANSEDDI